jgi:hypothetical protein
VDPGILEAVLWIALVAALVLGIPGAMHGGSGGLLAAAVASAVLLTVSFLAGFSIGPFTAGIAVAITVIAVTHGTRWREQALAVAAVVYLLLIWVLPRVARTGLTSVAGGIVEVAILCGMAYVVAASIRFPDADSRPVDGGTE